jgi:hypothetical protein
MVAHMPDGIFEVVEGQFVLLQLLPRFF